MTENKVLFIGLVWPEPTSSAAGKRILQLVEFFLKRGDAVIFSSAATKSEASFELNKWNVKEVPVQLNHSSFHEFLKKINPNIVVYDRFVSEEQFGWRVTQECPNAVQILDTEDLHFLRAAREKAYKKQEEIDLYNEITTREIASILRSDLSLMISEFEMDLLQNEFKITPSLLHYLPFLENTSLRWLSEVEAKSFDERKDFIFIGNFLHEPNWQTVLHLKKNIWPKIKSKLPDANLQIYGAYPSQKVWDLHNEKQGFLVQGKAKDALEVISKARILLAPIPFGAGQKGKFIDAMQAGTPIATTSIGAEGMFSDVIPGIIEDNENIFISKTIELYQKESLWHNAQEIGFQILNKKFDKNLFQEEFNQKIIEVQSNLSQHRKQNFIGQILKSNATNALKYMSLWIEAKNSK
ncbi:MAG: glycosyltransferase family 4 protein [Flavobacteriaceae bacterium]|jgi:glycosyltransferase involved in cell wall biosynthesis|nr:glycosyltransferase family 4 protein [Flavobacteriaceae bacterium]